MTKDFQSNRLYCLLLTIEHMLTISLEDIRLRQIKQYHETIQEMLLKNEILENGENTRKLMEWKKKVDAWLSWTNPTDRSLERENDFVAVKSFQETTDDIINLMQRMYAIKILENGISYKAKKVSELYKIREKVLSERRESQVERLVHSLARSAEEINSQLEKFEELADAVTRLRFPVKYLSQTNLILNCYLESSQFLLEENYFQAFRSELEGLRVSKLNDQSRTTNNDLALLFESIQERANMTVQNPIAIRALEMSFQWKLSAQATRCYISAENFTMASQLVYELYRSHILRVEIEQEIVDQAFHISRRLATLKDIGLSPELLSRWECYLRYLVFGNQQSVVSSCHVPWVSKKYLEAYQAECIKIREKCLQKPILPPAQYGLFLLDNLFNSLEKWGILSGNPAVLFLSAFERLLYLNAFLTRHLIDLLDEEEDDEDLSNMMDRLIGLLSISRTDLELKLMNRLSLVTFQAVQSEHRGQRALRELLTQLVSVFEERARNISQMSLVETEFSIVLRRTKDSALDGNGRTNRISAVDFDGERELILEAQESEEEKEQIPLAVSILKFTNIPRAKRLWEAVSWYYKALSLYDDHDDIDFFISENEAEAMEIRFRELVSRAEQSMKGLRNDERREVRTEMVAGDPVALREELTEFGFPLERAQHRF